MKFGNSLYKLNRDCATFCLNYKILKVHYMILFIKTYIFRLSCSLPLKNIVSMLDP